MKVVGGGVCRRGRERVERGVGDGKLGKELREEGSSRGNDKCGQRMIGTFRGF